MGQSTNFLQTAILPLALHLCNALGARIIWGIHSINGGG